MDTENKYHFKGDSLAHTLRSRLDNFSKLRKPWEDRWNKAWKRFTNTYEKELSETEGEGWRSKLYYGMTRQKIRVAVSILSDSILQQGKLPYELKPTPVSDSEDTKVAEELKIDPVERTKNMSRLIDDQFIESKINDELYSIILSSAIYGTGVLKGPIVEYRKRNRWIPKVQNGDVIPEILPDDDEDLSEDEVTQSIDKAQKVVKENIQYEFQQNEVPVPSLKACDIWDLYCDLENEDVQASQGIFQRALLTKEALAQLSLERDENGKQKYDVEAIQEILSTHNGKDKNSKSYSDFDGDRGPHREKYEGESTNFYSVFTYAGSITQYELASYQKKEDELDRNSVEAFLPVEVIVTFCRNKILALHENPHPKKIRPYHVTPWSRVPGSPYGWGLADELEHSQSAFNGFLRLFIDNKRLAGSLGFILDETRIQNPDVLIQPGFRFKVTAGSSVRDAIQHIVTPDIGGNLMQAMEFCERWGNTDSGIPAFLTGDNVMHKAQTAYEANELKSSALKQLAMPIRYLDERVIVPLVESFHFWNMQNHPDESVKGDFEVEAKGFSSFTDRLIRGNELQKLLALSSQDPEIAQEVNKGEIIRELTRIGQLPEDRFLKTKEEKEQLQKNQNEQLQLEREQALLMARDEKRMEHMHEIRMLKIKLEHESGEKKLDRDMKIQELQDKLLDSAMKIEALRDGRSNSAKAS